MLLEQANEIGKDYLKNFGKDFLQIDNITLGNLVFSNIIKIPIEKYI